MLQISYISHELRDQNPNSMSFCSYSLLPIQVKAKLIKINLWIEIVSWLSDYLVIYCRFSQQLSYRLYFKWQESMLKKEQKLWESVVFSKTKQIPCVTFPRIRNLWLRKLFPKKNLAVLFELCKANAYMNVLYLCSAHFVLISQIDE